MDGGEVGLEVGACSRQGKLLQDCIAHMRKQCSIELRSCLRGRFRRCCCRELCRRIRRRRRQQLLGRCLGRCAGGLKSRDQRRVRGWHGGRIQGRTPAIPNRKPTKVCQRRPDLNRDCTSPAHSALGQCSPSPHLHLDWTEACHICTGTRLAPLRPLPHLHRDAAFSFFTMSAETPRTEGERCRQRP